VSEQVLRRMCGLKREEVAGCWQSLQNEELCSLYVSPHTMKVIKSGRIKWVGHVAMWER